MKEIKEAAINILRQLNTVVSALDPEDYKKPVLAFNGATIGQHVRHTLEFFVCLMDANACTQINYDGRKRDKDIEEDTAFASQVFDTINDFLTNVTADKELELMIDYGINEDHTVKVKTNLYREIAYNIEHLVHHMALIKIGLKEVAGYVSVPEGFGIANSTIRHISSQPEY